MATQEEMIAEVASHLARARRVGVLTGAGISAESGIRTFRDTMDGLWKDFDAQTLATPEAFGANPEMVTRWYDWRRLGCLAAEPNAGHLALVELERRLAGRGGGLTVLTQNVDGLHQRAGSRDVVELHGSIHEWRCTRTGRVVRPGPGEFAEFPPRSEWGGVLRPGVVWFGEALPGEALAAAAETAQGCDVFMSIGTSAVVYPAAGFIELAAEAGAVTVEVNREATGYSGRVDYSLRGGAGEVLGRVLGAGAPGA